MGNKLITKILLLFLISIPILLIPQNVLGYGQDSLANEFNQSFCTPTLDANLTIQNQSTPSISLGTRQEAAGAITSLIVNGVQTVDTEDIGRLLQYALYPPSLGGCYNPTEAGSAKATWTDGSDSHFIEGCTSNNKLYTKSQMAFWLPPNNDASVCGPGVTKSLNTTVLSDYIVSKKIEIGYNNDPNIIRMIAKIEIPTQIAQSNNKLEFELPTGYHWGWLSSLYLLNQTTGILFDTAGDPNLFHNESSGGMDKWYWGLEIPVMSTPDKKLAVAVYAPYVQRYGFGARQAGAGGGASTKWHILYDLDNVQAGNLYFESFLIVGDLNTVKTKALSLAESKPQRDMPPVGWLDTLPDGNIISGWAGDPNAHAKNKSADVHLFKDGPSGIGSFLGVVHTGLPRGDVNYPKIGSNSGFKFTIPESYLDGKSHSIYAYVIDDSPAGYPPQSVKLGGSNQQMIFHQMSVASIPGDLNHDGHVDLFDYNILISKFGNPYTLIDFNTLLRNYGT